MSLSNDVSGPIWEIQGIHRPDEGIRKHLWNTSQYLPGNTTQHTRRQPSSYSSLWEPQRGCSLFEGSLLFCHLPGESKKNRKSQTANWKQNQVPLDVK
jgi:hypothetical protein